MIIIIITTILIWWSSYSSLFSSSSSSWCLKQNFTTTCTDSTIHILKECLSNKNMGTSFKKYLKIPSGPLCVQSSIIQFSWLNIEEVWTGMNSLIAKPIQSQWQNKYSFHRRNYYIVGRVTSWTILDKIKIDWVTFMDSMNSNVFYTVHYDLFCQVNEIFRALSNF